MKRLLPSEYAALRSLGDRSRSPWPTPAERVTYNDLFSRGLIFPRPARAAGVVVPRLYVPVLTEAGRTAMACFIVSEPGRLEVA